MKTQTQLLRKTALAAAVAIVVSGVASVGDFAGMETGMSPFVSSAYAGDGGSGNGQKGAMGENRGGQGARGAGDQGHKGGRSVADVLADDDDGDDSDRPDWAGVPGGEGRPGGGGNDDSGTTKGDTYGDMILLVRDQETGEPITVDGWTLACTDPPACTEAAGVVMEEGEVPAGTTTYEVDLGRGSLIRAPTGVIDRRLEEALSLIESRDDGTAIEQDEAGRIVVVVDGVEKTIDSPLENLALYIDLMEGLIKDGDSATEAALGDDLASLNTAASLLAASADKTGDISLDYLMYSNLIGSVEVEFGEVNFEYERAPAVEPEDYYEFWYSPDGVVAPELKTIDLSVYLAEVNGALPAVDETAALFAAAADDAQEVIELTHTQIVTDDFLESNGFDPGLLPD